MVKVGFVVHQLEAPTFAAELVKAGIRFEFFFNPGRFSTHSFTVWAESANQVADVLKKAQLSLLQDGDI